MPSVSTTRIESTADQGRVLVANTSFAVGDQILREAPLLAWPAGDSSAFLDALCEADDATRAAVMDMYRPPLDSPDDAVAALRQEASLLLMQGGGRPQFCDLDFAHAALLVLKLNAHSFNGGSHAALFEKGSKVSHSCAPNAAYSSRDVDGMLVIKAIREVAEDEQVTMSYIGDLWLKPTGVRRAELKETKLFTCWCARCKVADPLRAMPCTVKDAHTVVMESVVTVAGSDRSKDEVLNDVWRCSEPDCCAIPNEQEAELLQLEESAVGHKLQNEVGMALVEVGPAGEPCVEEPEGVIQVADLVPRTNATAIRSRLLAGTVLRSRAEDAGDAPAAKKLRLRAAQEVLCAVRTLQCVAAGCVKSQPCGAEAHPPVYHNCPLVMDAVRDLHAAGKELDGACATAGEAVRYFALMHVMWPKLKKDADMMKILDDLMEWASNAPVTGSV